ncbi:PAS domain-containing protein [Nisaea sp.]|uniref:PAS domain-containing protein n=1 Tax=Nisaea sp. TaxID=2024842 RepID=UPI002B268D39|nr:PAS domain-containing protein [Nisaea sp.]
MTSILDKVRSLSVKLVRYEKTAQILHHWIDLSGAEGTGIVPRFDPIAVPSLLPFVYLLQRNGDRLKYRVSGEEVNRLFEQNHTGRYLHEVVPNEIYGEVAPYFFSVFDPCICIFRGRVLLPDREYMSFERVLLPVMRNGEIQLLGTLALSSTTPLRTDMEPSAAPGPGLHFTLIDLESGKVETSKKNLEPLANRYRPPTSLCG